jgi:hypothetical protein
MEEENPKYAILNCGESYKTSEVYEKLWRYHNTLVRKWKDESPGKFKKS